MGQPRTFTTINMKKKNYKMALPLMLIFSPCLGLLIASYVYVIEYLLNLFGVPPSFFYGFAVEGHYMTDLAFDNLFAAACFTVVVLAIQVYVIAYLVYGDDLIF